MCVVMGEAEQVSVMICLHAERGQTQQDTLSHDVCQKPVSYSPRADSLNRSWPEGKDMDQVTSGHIVEE